MSEMQERILQYQETPGAVLVDLRDEEDYRSGHIPGAVNIQLANIREEIPRIAKFNTPIFLYCYTGNRSNQAEALLTAKGYTGAVSIGGIAEYDGETTEPTITVKELRASRGLSQIAFAQSLGVSSVTISAYETGRLKVSEKVADRIREVYHVELASAEKAGEPVPRGRKKAAAKAVPAPQLEKPKAGRGRKKASAPVITIQNGNGAGITMEALLAKVGTVDALYIRGDENRAYWVRGEENGSIALWE